MPTPHKEECPDEFDKLQAIKLKITKQILTKQKEELVREIEKMKVGYEDGFFDSDSKHQIYGRGEAFGFNKAIDQVINLISKK